MIRFVTNEYTMDSVLLNYDYLHIIFAAHAVLSVALDSKNEEKAYKCAKDFKFLFMSRLNINF